MINWIEIKPNKEIHGFLPGDELPVFFMEREKDPPHVWRISGLFADKSSYRNDLKDRADNLCRKLKLF